MFKTRKGQSAIEYAFLIGVIAAAIIAMSTYMRYAINYRLKQAQEELDGSYR